MEKAKATWAGLDEKKKKAVTAAFAVVLLLVVYLVFWWVPSCASAKTCKELKDAYGGWDLHNPGQRGDATVCGESDNGLGPDGTTQCYGGMNSNAATASTQDNSRGGWENANDICTEAGARVSRRTQHRQLPAAFCRTVWLTHASLRGAALQRRRTDERGHTRHWLPA